MAYYVARFILLKLRLKFQQPIAGEERHEWGFRFPGLGTIRREKREESHHALDECVGERQDLPWDRETRRVPWL